jgi:hypothetical protein
MKKIIISCIVLLAACGESKQEGVFVRHGQSEYSIADDTLTINDGIVTNNVGFNRVRSGELKPREYSTKTWRLNEFGSPIIVFESNGLKLGSSFYKKIR